MPISAPADLDRVDGKHLHLTTEEPHMGRLLGRLWRAAKLAGGEAALTERAGRPSFVATEWGAFQLASAVTAESASTSELGGRLLRCATELGSNERDCDRSAPRAQLQKVSERNRTVEQVSQFAQTSSEINQLWTCDETQKSTASGIR